MVYFILHNTYYMATLQKTDSFEQVYEFIPEDGVWDIETRKKRYLVKQNTCSKYIMCIWLKYSHAPHNDVSVNDGPHI